MGDSSVRQDKRAREVVPLSELHMPYYVRSSPPNMEGVRFTPSPDYSGKYGVRSREDLRVELRPCISRRL